MNSKHHSKANCLLYFYFVTDSLYHIWSTEKERDTIIVHEKDI
jgi:hypothetical protein